jgi:hypothetical protein
MNTFWLNKTAEGHRIITHQCPEEEGELEGILQDTRDHISFSIYKTLNHSSREAKTGYENVCINMC